MNPPQVLNITLRLSWNRFKIRCGVIWVLAKLGAGQSINVVRNLVFAAKYGWVGRERRGMPLMAARVSCRGKVEVGGGNAERSACPRRDLANRVAKSTDRAETKAEG